MSVLSCSSAHVYAVCGKTITVITVKSATAGADMEQLAPLDAYTKMISSSQGRVTCML
jgi:hypothetical protein